MNVIDASVAIKLLKSTEDDADRAKKLLHDHLTKATRITVPSLLYLEVANALVTKSIYTQEDIEELLHLLNTFDFVIHSFTKKISLMLRDWLSSTKRAFMTCYMQL